MHKPTTSGTCTNRDTSTQIFQLCRLCLRILNLLLDRLFYCSLLNNKRDNRVMTNCQVIKQTALILRTRMACYFN
ncbi:hypothetical protein T12_3509 [Trichinella patagoniensis]|uniref:Uncharacterized protein n=1 Tax=Trichinella patagoniensis TaxID=990121 RepID=A0A0V1ABD8_9BILA|nr:hypothetical protein T12_3509 [Trichinella patagoniensis]